MKFSEVISISRPRFWMYILGPVLVGAISSISFNVAIPAWLPLLLAYATLPANLFIYGLNDIADRDTDAHNPKKGSYEHRLPEKRSSKLLAWIAGLNIPFLVVLLYLESSLLTGLIVFLFFGAFYSLKPIRAKAIPIFDGIFNVLYLGLGFATYTGLSGLQPDLKWVLAGTMWCMAMHAFSAIPDIEADKKANLKTTATLLGYEATLFYVAVLFTLSSLIFTEVHLFTGILGAFCYLFLVFRARKKETIFSVYRLFPTVNTLLGMMVFFSVLLFRI